MKNKAVIFKLKKISLELKKKILEISYNKKTHHIGSCLSCIDILTVLYFGFMKINKTKINLNDKFIMSKGHAALSYYLILFSTTQFLVMMLKHTTLTLTMWQCIYQIILNYLVIKIQENFSILLLPTCFLPLLQPCVET